MSDTPERQIADTVAVNEHLARTWNSNESGRLWEALWYRKDGRYYVATCAPGVFTPPHEYPDEAAFWAAFEREREQFGGAHIDGCDCYLLKPEDAAKCDHNNGFDG